jgi:hypothetical protein
VTNRPPVSSWKTRGPESGYAFAPGVDNPHLAHTVADALKLVREPHALGDVVAEAPEVDHVSAGAQAWRALDNRGLETGGVEPKGERRPSDSGAGDENRLGAHARALLKRAGETVVASS